jgi:hypothetical protein
MAERRWSPSNLRLKGKDTVVVKGKGGGKGMPGKA